MLFYYDIIRGRLGVCVGGGAVMHFYTQSQREHELWRQVSSRLQQTQFKWIMWTDTAMTTLNLIVAGTKHPNGQIVQILLLFLCDVYLIFVIIESYREI